MKFQMEGLTVFFPYEYIYPEQARMEVCVQDSVCVLGSMMSLLLLLALLH